VNKLPRQIEEPQSEAERLVAALRRCKSAAYLAADESERAWHRYASLLDVGPDREHAFDVYDNLRNARRG
jgi:hypothetical protein